jgi:hypothetical protein
MLLAIADRAIMDTTKTYLPEDAAMNDTVFSVDGKIRHDVRICILTIAIVCRLSLLYSHARNLCAVVTE